MAGPQKVAQNLENKVACARLPIFAPGESQQIHNKYLDS